jgi:hypothetical protein
VPRTRHARSENENKKEKRKVRKNNEKERERGVRKCKHRCALPEMMGCSLSAVGRCIVGIETVSTSPGRGNCCSSGGTSMRGMPLDVAAAADPDPADAADDEE